MPGWQFPNRYLYLIIRLTFVLIYIIIFISGNINKNMLKLSQNKKIALSAIALFLVSFSLMLFFLNNGFESTNHSQVNVLEINGHAGYSSEAVDLEMSYRNYLKDPNAPFFVTDATGEIKYAGKDFCQFLSVKCDVFVGSVLFDYINSKDLSTVVADHTKLIQEGEPAEGLGPYRMLKRDKELLLLFNAYPVSDKDGKVSEIIFSVKDLTEQVEELKENKEKQDRFWLEKLYPKIKDVEDQQDIRMVVDKISYNKDE